MDGNVLKYDSLSGGNFYEGKVGGGSSGVDKNISHISADEVLTGLWIGNQAAAASIDFIKSNGIKTIFNATKHLPFAKVDGGLVEIRIPVNDPGPFNGLEQDDVARMSRALPCAVDMLHHSLGKGGVLVHCHAGMQRSAALVTAYLAKYYFHKLDNPKKGGYTAPLNQIRADALFERARDFLHSKRSLVFYHNWYVNFEKAIKHYIRSGMENANVAQCVK